jgi:hypothetical protein
MKEILFSSDNLLNSLFQYFSCFGFSTSTASLFVFLDLFGFKPYLLQISSVFSLKDLPDILPKTRISSPFNSTLSPFI